eukprot:192713-Rhodomonas_salina.1
MSGTGVAYGAIAPCAPYAMSGTDIAFGAPVEQSQAESNPPWDIQVSVKSTGSNHLFSTICARTAADCICFRGVCAYRTPQKANVWLCVGCCGMVCPECGLCISFQDPANSASVVGSYSEVGGVQVLGKTLPMELRVVVWNTKDTAAKDMYVLRLCPYACL